ncbi:hypothetical protein N9J68_01105 [Gammaproteobacteria bacterium]|jgi:hypothetical protein|nr:hypothetical protein [Gammaproteobacteria bacterium]MDA7802634.1 hypothetical protein [Gammaproteobacteria bacterium]MDA7856500.1 hypothetical protein [Gammaproteobacteria bacterium]MDA8856631.1 hypothetical protein [Gammaproteobacteria bacterium]MDA8957569.1 hypothetical protein [Gammaproteobacteria bacterium]|tara:strand:- start:8084 stop:8287 length:204 start_codon:yes stop_codon:yes gene_type:complete
MKNLKAFSIIGLITASVGILLYAFDAHLNYRNLFWAIGISTTLLITHILNMAVYFKVAGDQPYKWFK